MIFLFCTNIVYVAFNVTDGVTKGCKKAIEHRTVNNRGAKAQSPVVKLADLLVGLKWRFQQKLRPRGFKREMNSDISPFTESETPVIVVTFEVKIRGAGKVKGTADC